MKMKKRKELLTKWFKFKLSFILAISAVITFVMLMLECLNASSIVNGYDIIWFCFDGIFSITLLLVGLSLLNLFYIVSQASSSNNFLNNSLFNSVNLEIKKDFAVSVILA